MKGQSDIDASSQKSESEYPKKIYKLRFFQKMGFCVKYLWQVLESVQRLNSELLFCLDSQYSLCDIDNHITNETNDCEESRELKRTILCTIPKLDKIISIQVLIFPTVQTGWFVYRQLRKNSIVWVSKKNCCGFHTTVLISIAAVSKLNWRIKNIGSSLYN